MAPASQAMRATVPEGIRSVVPSITNAFADMPFAAASAAVDRPWLNAIPLSVSPSRTR